MYENLEVTYFKTITNAIIYNILTLLFILLQFRHLGNDTL